MYSADAAFHKRFIAYARFFSESRGTNHDALRSLRFMKHQTQLTPPLYSVWIDTLALAGERGELRLVLAEMRNRAIQVNQEHYKRLMFAMSAFREYGECEALARNMKADGITPTPDFFDDLLTRDQSEQLKPVWKILRDNSIPVVPPVNDQGTKGENAPPPTPTFVSHLIDSIKNASEKECIELLRELRDMHANTALYNTLINHAPNERIAWMIFNGMVQQGVTPTVFTFNTLLRAPSSVGIKGCVEVLAVMKKHSMISNATNLIFLIFILSTFFLIFLFLFFL
jgi:hypothetical protein